MYSQVWTEDLRGANKVTGSHGQGAEVTEEVTRILDLLQGHSSMAERLNSLDPSSPLLSVPGSPESTTQSLTGDFWKRI